MFMLKRFFKFNPFIVKYSYIDNLLGIKQQKDETAEPKTNYDFIAVYKKKKTGKSFRN